MNKTKPFRLLFVLMIAAGLTGCASSSMKSQPVPALTFAHLSPIGLNVAEIAVDSKYQAPTEAPHVESKFTPPPAEALKMWARDRLRARGSTNVAQFTVLNAPVTVEPLPRTSGFAGAFTIEPAEKYTMTVEAELRIVDAEGHTLGGTSARVTNSRTLEEGATPDERALLRYELTKSVMDSFDAEMERAIRTNLAAWVR